VQEAAPQNELPRRIGRYDVLRLLGQGGMGRVLLARDSVLGRFVAVKILRGDLGLPPESQRALFARMEQEAKAAAAIDHPNIVTLHDMGEEAPVGLYLVFELVTGPTLRERIAEGPIDLDVVARMARALGDALTTAHEAGVIHRDVKPENVILSKHGAKLTDFGIARLPDSTLTVATVGAGVVLGTPAYSAPEALASGDFSPRSDQFSLACTLYEALGSKRAYQGEDALATAAKIANEPPPPLPFTVADTRLLARLDNVLARALAKEPEKRFPTCRALGEALAGVIEARVFETPRPDSSTPPPRSIIPRATRRVHNLIAAAALLVIVGLIVFGQPRGEGVSLREVADSFGAVAAVAHAPAPTSRPPRRVPATHDADAGEHASGAAPNHTQPQDAALPLVPSSAHPTAAPPTPSAEQGQQGQQGAGAEPEKGADDRDTRLPSVPAVDGGALSSTLAP
jgi:serine/threonine-protein kinase